MVHPNSLANLENGKRFQSGDERAVICGQKGREALTENIRQRKLVAEYLEDLLQTPVAEEKIRAELERRGVKRKDRNYAAACAMAILGKVLKGDMTAGKLALSLVGEMPKEESSVNMTVSEGNQVIAYVPDDGREPNGSN